MRIISNKKWNELQDLITGLQQDYNDLKDSQVNIQCEYKYMQEQKEIAEAQVEYLRKEIAKLIGGKKNVKGNKD